MTKSRLDDRVKDKIKNKNWVNLQQNLQKQYL